MHYEALRELTESHGWRQVAEEAVRGRELPASFKDAFGTYWIEAGHHVREQVADDRLLCQMLRLTLPAHSEGSQTLYRGENLTRWKVGAVGLSWTRDIEVARMFGRGLNATRSGGVLLVARFTPAAIISGPNKHSVFLQEHQYTVDPTLAEEVRALEHYPPA